MRLVRPFTPVLLVLAFALTGSASSAGSHAPGDRCAGRLVSPTFGYAVCGDRLLVSRDGRSWRAVTPAHPAQAVIHDVVFLGEQRAWLVTNDCSAARARVFRTTDGGRSWRSTPVDSTNCSAGSRLELGFRNSRQGWLVRIFENGNRQWLETTDDGGRTWSRLAQTLPFIGSAVFRTAQDGWFGRSDFATQNGLAETRNGGRSWRFRVLPPPPDWRGARMFPDVPAFFGSRGVVPVSLTRRGTAAIAFYVTEDGGRRWRFASLRQVRFTVLRGTNPFVRYVPTSIAGPSTWWAVDQERRIYVTTTGGRRWRVLHPGNLLASPLLTISAVDGNHAWLNADKLFATQDAGHSWRLINPG
jgi:photosystem II stability/assembly factor-like uncharacterized protein